MFRNEVRTEEVIELNLRNETKTPDTSKGTQMSNNIPKRNRTPEFLVQMRKRQMIRAEKREEIRKVHEQKAEEKKRQVNSIKSSEVFKFTYFHFRHMKKKLLEFKRKRSKKYPK